MQATTGSDRIEYVDSIGASSTAAPHPEEMNGSITFRLGNLTSITIAGRATPAGLATAALLACAILVPLLRVVRARDERSR